MRYLSAMAGGLFASFAMLVAAFAAAPPGDPAGLRFRCDDLIGKEICLPVLQPDCKLSIAQERQSRDGRVELSIPPEASQVLMLSCPQLSREVHSPRDLAGHVSIDTGSEALEYLRFFTAMSTVHLFEEKQMEIFLGSDEECFSSCLPSSRRAALELEPTTVEQLSSGFRVSRNIVRPIPSPVNVTAFRTVVDVLPDGMIHPRDEKELALTLEDQARLTFPGYM